MGKYYSVARDSLGNAVPSPTITVYDPSSWVNSNSATTAASIYSDIDMQTAKANPFTGGSDGSFEFYAPAGRYRILVSKSGFTGSDETDIWVPGEIGLSVEETANFNLYDNHPSINTYVLNGSSLVVTLPAVRSGSGTIGGQTRTYLGFLGNRYVFYNDAATAVTIQMELSLATHIQDQGTLSGSISLAADEAIELLCCDIASNTSGIGWLVTNRY